VSRKIELALLETPVMFNLDGMRRFGFFWHFLPDRIDVGTIEITSAIPAPTPYYSAKNHHHVRRGKETHTP
jgi:hypothetical protein